MIHLELDISEHKNRSDTHLKYNCLWLFVIAYAVITRHDLIHRMVVHDSYR
jgi:hypothetical protein